MIGRPSRRYFLKTLGAGGALIASPALAQTAWTIRGSERGVLRLVFYSDVHLERARNAEPGDKRRRDFATAYWENRILEDYFGELVRASSYRWPAGLEAEVRNGFRTDRPYDSWVSRHLITSFTRGQVFWLFLGAVIGLLLLGSWFGRRAPG